MFLDLRTGRLIEPLSGRAILPDDIRARVLQRAAALRARGLAPRERAFIHFGNCIEFFVELLAVWSVGACAVPIDARFTAFEIETLATWAKPRLSLWADAPDPGVAAALARAGVATVDVTQNTPDAAAAATAPFRLDDDALILFTSGTTGDPKGVVHTHRSLRARWTSLRQSLGLDAFRRTLCLLPTHFGHGLICNCLFPWLSGQDLYILPPFKADILSRLGSIIDEHEITFMSSVPAVWRLALRISKPPAKRSLARVFIGSAPLTAAVWTSVREWTGARDVMNAYGITETGSWLAGTTVPGFEPTDGLVGVAWGGVLKVLRSNDVSAPLDPATECAPGESGHVWVNTPALMRGYLDRDDLTDRVVSGGWFLTGDIGMRDAHGWLHLRGRERDEINKGGMKVYPADVDSVVERFPAVLDVCTFAFEDPLLGEDVGIAVVLESTDAATRRGLFDWTAQHLARHQVPQRWYFVAEIPRTSRGKVSRLAVATSCTAATPTPMGPAAPKESG